MPRKPIAYLVAALLLAVAAFWRPEAAYAGTGTDNVAAAQVEVRSGLHEGYARIVVKWKRLPAFHTGGDTSVVEVRFAKPLQADLTKAIKSLDGWVERAEISADGQTLRLHLARELAVRTFPLGSMAVIDLIDTAAVAEAAAKAKAKEESQSAAKDEPAAEAASEKLAKASSQETSKQTPKAASKETPKAAPKEAKKAPAKEPGKKPEIAAAPDSENTPIRITPAAKAEAEKPEVAPLPSVSLPSVATAPDHSSAALAGAQAAVALEAAAPTINVESKDHGSFSRLIFNWDQAVDYEIERVGETVTVLFDAPGKIDLLGLRRALPKRFSSLESALSDGKLILQVNIGEALRLRHFQKGARIVIDALEVAGTLAMSSRPSWASQGVLSKPGVSDRLKKLAEKSVSEKKETSAIAQMNSSMVSVMRRNAARSSVAGRQQSAELAVEPGRPESEAERVLGAKLPPAPPLIVATETISGGMRLRFMWDRRVGASVFRRMGYLWMVFDVPRVVDLSTLGMSDKLTGMILSADQLRAPGATVLRFGIASDLWPRVARSGATWMVELTDAQFPPAKPLLIRTEPSAIGGARVLVPTPGAGRRIKFDDPEVGDSIVVVPISEPGVGVKTGRDFVQFTILPSAQGMAFMARADDIAIGTNVTGVEVKSERELYMSADVIVGASRPAKISDGSASSTGPVLFEYEAWRRDDLGDYLEAKQHLQNAVISAGIEGRTQRRLNLANFNFAHGLAEDAIGVIQRIAEEDSSSEERPDFVALRGATLMLLGRAEQAALDLNRELLDGYMDVTLWRAALTATRGDWEGADSAFVISGPAFERLPSDLRARFGLLAAHAALSVGNIHRVNLLVERIENEASNPKDRAEARFLQAKAYQRTGNTIAALELYEELALNGSRPLRARSELSRVELMLHLGRMNRNEAIEALEQLRHAWRGDSFEQLLLRRLAELYRKEQNYLNALLAMRDAVEFFAESAATPAVTEQMDRMFSDLFIEGGADALSPLTALSLYYEFGEFAPDGASGGRIAEELANRLVDVDLLDRAAELLSNQLAAIDGVDKARVGAHLAVIQLLDQEAEQAIETLKQTHGEGTEIPAALMLERRHLQARALSAIDQAGEALALLEKDKSREASLLRADINWRAEMWAEAAQEFDKVFDAVEGDVSTEEQHLIMRHVVALMLSEDAAGLEAVRARYGESMSASVYNNAFDLITKSADNGDVPVHELPRILANIEGVEAFLTTYRDSPEDKEANTVN
ncbi:MAG: tetratricopeptide repeat protein [Rhodospirillaceae bacterium]|nr:tetratricopeptide repeat protein [Rhodospirillaceae bacterium]